MWPWGTTRRMSLFQQTHTSRRPSPLRQFSGLMVAGAALLWGAGPAQAACTTSPKAEAEAVRKVARSAAQDTLSSRAFLYRLMYDDISYQVNVGQAAVKGNTARVNGSIVLRGKERTSGKVMGQTYQGVVFLTKNGCNWQATGYQQG